MTKLWPWAVLLLLGLGWGSTFPLTKTAVSTGYGHWGLVFWQLALGAVFLGAVLLIRGRPLKLGLPQIAVAVMIALIGTIFPNSASYQAAVHLPAGMMAILIASVSIFAYPVAILLRADQFHLRRVGGLILGLCAVIVLSWPQLSKPEAGDLPFILLALVAPLFYAFEGNIVGKFGTAGLDAIETLFLASLIGTVIMLPVVYGTGQYIQPIWPLPKEQIAIICIALIHGTVYSGYVWFVGAVGAVFAAQVSYAVTLFGVMASATFLREDYPPTLWMALVLMIGGMALVQPKKGQ